jgi:hypothetical protein
MKKFTFLTILLLGFFLGITINGSGQTVIWSEDFSTYVEGTGIEGPGTVNIGDYPAGVTKWTLDVSGCTLSNADDYIKTDYEKLKSQDLEGPAIWLSESINLSAYSNGASFSIKFYEYSSMEFDDYIDVFYQLNGGDFVLIPNWNGHGSDIHTLIDDFSNDTVVQSVSACNNLVIKVIFDNDSGFEEFQMDDVFVYPNMEYVSSTTTQNTHKIAAGKTNRQIIGIEVVTTGTESPISITQFTINANGSSTPVSTNIENAKIYCTGTDNTFATGTQFGSTYASPTTTNFDITGTQQLSEGTNYFWLTFDTKTGATLGGLIDAECISFIVEGSTETPAVTAPAGNRTLSAPLSGSYTIGAKSNYASFTAAANDLNDLGISGTVSFAVASGTYTEQISLSAIDGTSATDTIVFQSSTSDPADVTLQFTPTSSANYVVSFDGSDYISFLDMTIQTTGTSSYGKVFVFEGATQNITLKGNNIIGRDISLQDDDYIVIFAEGGTSNIATNINIENDTIRYGSKSIYFDGGDDNNLETGNTFINNAFEGFYYYGLETWYQDAVIINKNRFTGKDTGSSETGIKTTYCHNAIEINQNRVFVDGTNSLYGIYLYHCYGTTANTGLVANNFVSQPDANIETIGIFIKNTGHQNIYHNTVNIYSASKSNTSSRTGTKTGFSIEAMWADANFGWIKLLNNIAAGVAQNICVNQTAVDEGYLENSDNNDWFTLDDILGKWGATDCPDLAAWQAASGMGAGSVGVDPGFVSSQVPDITNETLGESVPLKSEVPKDIRNTKRKDTTTPGATILTNRWKVNGSDSDWNNPQNWSLGEVPTNNHNVFIPEDCNYFPALSGDAACNNLNIDGFLYLNGHTLNIAGHSDCNGGVISGQGGKFTFNGNDDQNFSNTGELSDINVDVDKPSTLVLMFMDVFSVKNLHLLNGFIDANNNKIEASENVNLSGGSIINPSNIELTNPTAVTFNPGNNTFNNIYFTGGGTYDVLAKMIVEGDFLANGTVNAYGNDFEFGRDVDLSNCNYNHGNGKFIVNGDGDQDIWTGMAAFFLLRIESVTYNGKTTRIFTPNDAQVIVAEIMQIVTSFLFKENSISDTVKFYGNVQCNNDFTIGTQDVGGVIVNIMHGYNLTVNGNTTINNSGTLVIKSNATGTFNQKITLY